MDTLLMDSEDKKVLNDSGCAQDVGPPMSPEEPEYRSPELLDLSDDVLLYILRHCSPMDLKALGYTCPRLGRLICDRTLWQRVDAREHPTGRVRMRWLLAHALGANTTALLLSGYAREARGCLGHVNRKREEVEEEKAMKEKADKEGKVPSPSQDRPPLRGDTPVQIIQVDPLTRLQRLYTQHLPSAYASMGSPSWPEEAPAEVDPEDVVLLDGSCPGPQFTFTQCMLRQLRAVCRLTELALEYCNINCNTTGLSHFPSTLKKLSLRGSKCYNLPLDKSFLFNIQDYLPHLEYLNLSECEWLEPASFLPLSKVSRLTHLVMRDCYRLSEFVAYASLSSRYGFKALKMVDFRGSPVADSEVSALGWLPALQELYISPAPKVPPHPPDHSHYRDEPLPTHPELQPWEAQEPEYFKIKPRLVEPMDNRATTSNENIEQHIEKLRDYENSLCLHGMEYNLCTDGLKKSHRKRQAQKPDTSEPSKEEPSGSKQTIEPPKEDPKPPKRKEHTDNERPGPSPKRGKDEEPGPSPKKRKFDQDDQKPCSSKSIDTPSTSSRYTNQPKTKDDSDSSDDDNIPLKMLCRNGVNEGASTSRSPPKSPRNTRRNDNPRCQKPNEHPKDCKCDDTTYEFVRFRQNMEPVFVRRDGSHREREAAINNLEVPNREARPRAHVLYVNVGQQLHTVYRLSIQNEPPIFYSFARNSHLRYRPNVGNIFYTPPTPHLDAESLVTDSAVRRFGRSEVEEEHVVHIGPNRGGDPSARPNRSSLRILSITGFRNITDRSLVHLATAAPHLRVINFSQTAVTAQGVDNFRSLRPDCEVTFSPYIDDDED